MALSKSLRLTAFALCAAAETAATAAPPVQATFTGAESRVWHNGLNWDINTVPNNTVSTQYAVHLTTECSFFSNCRFPEISVSPGLIEVSELHIGENVDFRILDGVFRPGATTFGYLAQITAHRADVEFTTTAGDYRWLRVRASDYGLVSGVLTEIPNCGYVLLEANDGGATEFPFLQSVSGPDPEATFTASAVGGTVDVSALTDLPVKSQWYAIDGGTITAGAFDNGTIAFITVEDDSVITLPGVTNLDGAELRISDDGILQTPPIESFDNGTIILDEGASYAMPISRYSSDRENGTQIRTRLSALSFPNLETIEIADGVNLTNSIEVGTISFPVLTEILGPGGRLYLDFGTPGELQVPQLTRVEPTAILDFSAGTHVVGPIEFCDIETIGAGGGALVHWSGDLDLTGTHVSLGNHSSLTGDAFTSIDDATIDLNMGSTFAPAIEACSITQPGPDWSVSGSGSHLDLSALQTLDLDWADGPLTFVASAYSGGRITLGDITISSSPDDRILFDVNGASSRIQIGPDAVIDGTSYWKVVNGGQIFVPSTVPIASPASFELRGGVLHVLGLHSFDGAFIGIYAPTEFLYGAEDIDLHNTVVITNQDWTLDALSWSWDQTGGRTVFLVTGRTFDAPQLRTMSIDPVPGAQPAELDFGASNRGVLDFSGVEMLDGPPAGSMHVLRVATSGTGSLVDFSGLQTTTGDIKIDANSYESVIDWGADLRHDAGYGVPTGSSFRTWNEGTLICRGSVFVTSTQANGPSLGTGAFIMAAPGTATLEVDNADGGTGVSFTPGIYQFRIGHEGTPTRVVLLDDSDNGGRGPNGEAESLYIGRTSVAEPLRIRPGASLVLNGLNVYVQSGAETTHLNTLWPDNVRAFAYDEGTLYRVDPAVCPADFSAPFGTLDIFDVLAFLELFTAGDTEADLNHDDRWDFFDLQALLISFSGGCN